MKVALWLASMAAAHIACGQSMLYYDGSHQNGYDSGVEPLTVTPADGYKFEFDSIWLGSGTPLSTGVFEIDIVPANGYLPYWSLVLAMPTENTPDTGFYGGATRWPFERSGTPGMDFTSAGSGYDHLTGWFDILEIQTCNGNITSLAVDFYQQATDYGSGLDPWEYGSIRYNSCIPPTVPEPEALAILGVGMMTVMIIRRRV